MSEPNDYHDIPGTYVFDAEQSRKGFHLNMFCMSLMKPENRAQAPNAFGCWVGPLPRCRQYPIH